MLKNLRQSWQRQGILAREHACVLVLSLRGQCLSPVGQTIDPGQALAQSSSGHSSCNSGSVNPFLIISTDMSILIISSVFGSARLLGVSLRKSTNGGGVTFRRCPSRRSFLKLSSRTLHCCGSHTALAVRSRHGTPVAPVPLQIGL